MNNTDKKVKEVLKQYGKIRKQGDVWIVGNEGRPSFSVEIFDSNPKKIVKVSPIFGQGVSKNEWLYVAGLQAKIIQEKVQKVVPKVL